MAELALAKKLTLYIFFLMPVPPWDFFLHFSFIFWTLLKIFGNWPKSAWWGWLFSIQEGVHDAWLPDWTVTLLTNGVAQSSVCVTTSHTWCHCVTLLILWDIAFELSTPQRDEKKSIVFNFYPHCTHHLWYHTHHRSLVHRCRLEPWVWVRHCGINNTVVYSWYHNKNRNKNRRYIGMKYKI